MQSNLDVTAELKHLRRKCVCGRLWLVDETTGIMLASEVELADTFWKKFRGLMFRRSFPRGNAILFKFGRSGRHSVHTFCVRFPIDLVYLDHKFSVVEVRAGLRPWRFYRPKSASRYLLELPAGTVTRKKIRAGHKIALKQENFPRRKGYN
ncbi:MAG TPA: DUF192 domain-containing protein [Hadesarchaea archaeon]|nr:DUF192 domain-containing protein [Hadesarchaea archaeon]